MLGETEIRALDWIGNDAVDVNKGFTGNSETGKKLEPSFNLKSEVHPCAPPRR